LLNKNKKIFIASNAPEDEVRKIVSERKLRKYFLAVKGAPLSKNESVGQILQGYNLHASDCVLFGDTESDGQVAESFEIDFVPINYFDKSRGYANFTELMESQVYV
jgi:phosphoglycolate phosphatase-like HAD superfamily hydrolase